MENKITDKGWTAMRAMLDREMPEKRRRRFVWWWFVLLLAPVAVYSSWHWLGSNNAPPPKPLTTEPIANAFQGASTPLMAQPAAGTKAPDDKTDKTSSSPTVRERSRSISTLKQPAIRHASKLLGNFRDKKGLNRQVLPAESLVQETSNLALETSNTEELAQGGAFILTPQLSLALLPTPVQMLELQDNSNILPLAKTTAELPKTTHKPEIKSWAFGSTSAIATEQFSTINGFSTGLTVDWNFARKWGLRTGLMYDIHHPQEKYRPVASVRSDNYTSTVEGNVIVLDVITGNELVNLPGNNFYADSLDGNVFIPVNRLQRLEIPVAVFWQAARPLKIFGGLCLTRTLTAKAERQNYSGEYILKLADRTAADGASRLSSTELDNWSADAMIGAGMKIGKIFELGVSAKVPLNKFPSFSKTNTPSVNAGLTNHSLGSTRKQNSPVFSLYGTLFF